MEKATNSKKEKAMCISKVRVNGNYVPCRKCWECALHRQNEWIFRIKQEIKVAKNAYFMTYQYNEHNVPIIQPNGVNSDGEIQTKMVRGVHNITNSEFVRSLYYKDVQDYFKRLRKAMDSWYKKHRDGQKSNIRYYVVGEYGEKTKRPHYHAIVISDEDISTTPFLRNLQILWDTYTNGKPSGKQNGYVHRDNAVHRSIRYTIKYMTKRIQDTPILAEQPRACMSRGLGLAYVDNNKEYHLSTDRRYLVEEGGYKIPLPEYYRKKIYSFKWKTEDGKIKMDNRAIQEILSHISSIQNDQEYDKLSDYQKFVRDTIQENKLSRANYERKENRLNKSSKSSKI